MSTDFLNNKMELNSSPSSSSYGSSSSDTDSIISETWILIRAFDDDIPRPNRKTGIIRIFPAQIDIFDIEEDFILQTFFWSVEQTNI